MAYSSVDQLRANLKNLNTNVSAPDIAAVGAHRITQADDFIEMDLNNIIDFSSMPDYPACPKWLNLLSQYKATELTIAYYYTTKRSVEEVNDITYYRMLYNEIRKGLFSGRISLGDYGTGVVDFTNKSKPEVEPALGVADYGEFETLEDLQTARPTDD